jgi:acetyltransferase (GNAT) family protein
VTTPGRIIRAYDSRVDESYVFAGWLNSYSSGSPWHEQVGPVYWREHHHAVERILARAKTLMLVWDEDPNVIIGFAVAEKRDEASEGLDTLHYVFIGPEYARTGGCKALVEALGLAQVGTFTHRTRHWRRWIAPEGQARRLDGWVYNPYPALT